VDLTERHIYPAKVKNGYYFCESCRRGYVSKNLWFLIYICGIEDGGKCSGKCGEKIKMKVDGKFELESIEVQKTLADEIGIYFTGGGEKRLAFAFDSPRKAISCAEKLKKVLNVKYNIVAEVKTLLLNEK